jgi:hypothetical protein
LVGGGPIRSLRAAGHEAEADFGGHFLLPRQQVSEQLPRDGPRSVVWCSLPFALVDGDRNCFLVSLDQDWTAAIAAEGRNSVPDGGEVGLVGIVLPETLLDCFGFFAVAIAEEGDGLLAVHVVEAQLDVLLPFNPATQFEESVVIAEGLAAFAGLILIREPHAAYLVGSGVCEVARSPRVEGEVAVLGVIISVVYVVGHRKHQVGGDEEPSSPEEYVGAIAEQQIADAVVGVACSAHLFGDIAEIVLIIVLLVELHY